MVKIAYPRKYTALYSRINQSLTLFLVNQFFLCILFVLRLKVKGGNAEETTDQHWRNVHSIQGDH